MRYYILEKMIDRLNQTFTDSEISKLKKGYEIHHLGCLGGLWEDEEFSKLHIENDDYLFFYDMFFNGIEEDENYDWVWGEYYQLINKKLYGKFIEVDKEKLKRDFQKILSNTKSD